MRKLISMLFLMFLAGTASADWIPDDGHKMHFPQLPDVTGWDVLAMEPKILADDFLCTQSGPITDIHFWGSWKDDLVGEIDNIHLSIHADIPADVNNYSRPGKLLWEWDGDAIILPIPSESWQGWYNPNTGEFFTQNHQGYALYNVFIPEPDAFEQEEGTIYWLDISVSVLPVEPNGQDPEPVQPEWGWKTSFAHWNDDGVWSDDGETWYELRDPISSESLDLAFVITPEPTTIALLGLGSLVLLRKRQK